MRVTLLVVPAVAALLGLGVARSPERPSLPPPSRVLLTADEAIAVGEPQMIAAPDVQTADWSPDGRYVLVQRAALRSTAPLAVAFRPGGPLPRGDVTLVVWTARTGRANEVWRQPIGTAGLGHATWLQRTSVALVEVSLAGRPPVGGQPAPEEPTYRAVLRVDAAAGTSRVIARAAPGDQLTVLASPTRPVALLWRDVPADGIGTDTGARQVAWQVVGADGAVGPPLRLPAEPGEHRELRWSSDGAQPLLMVLGRPAEPGARPQRRWYAPNNGSGPLIPLAGQPDVYAGPAAGPLLQAAPTLQTLKSGAGAHRMWTLWLKEAARADGPRVFVAAEARTGSVSPRGDAVLYQAHSAAWVVPLQRMRRAEYLAAMKDQVTGQAKQLGTALAMYCQDYDERFPFASDQINDMIAPYVQSTSVFDGFVYLWNGTGLAQIADPAETILGYVAEPGGRALIYADGHAAWKPDD